MTDIILFGDVSNIETIIEILERLKYRVVEVWDNFSSLRSIIYKNNEIRVLRPHRIKEETFVFITSDRYEDEIRRQLVEEFDIPFKLIKSWRYGFSEIKEKIIKKYEISMDEQMQSVVCFLKKNDLNIFNNDLHEKYKHSDENIIVKKDEECGLLYSYWGGKKIYMKRGMSEKRAKGYINSLKMEQDRMSPHCYEQCEFVGRANDVIVDAGAAEGFFSLERIDTARHIYLVESDSLWIEALRHTFAPYKEKVTILPKFISDYEDDKHITLNTLDQMGYPITIIKLDIEGGEKCALTGGKNILLQNRNLKLLVCAYHCPNDGEILSRILLDYHFDVYFTDGYMFFLYDKHITPKLRHGIIVAEKRRKVHVYVWGVGRFYAKLRRTIKPECIIDGVLDCNPSIAKSNDKYIVKHPSILKEKPFDYVIVTAMDCYLIESVYKEYGLPMEKLICLWDIDGKDYDFIDSNMLQLIKQEELQKKYKLRLENAPFEYGATNNIKILDAKILLNEILNKKKSLARFGDGELEIMRMKNRPWFQEATRELAFRLQEVIKAKSESLCIAIADNYGNLGKYTDEAADGIRKYICQDNTREDTLNFLTPNGIYYDAYVTRPYMIYKNKNWAKDIFSLWKLVWDKRKILLIEGEASRLGRGNDLLSNAKNIRRILCPEQNSFRVYEQILEKSIRYADESDLILISLGPTATVLAYDLNKLGYQAIDIGQLDNEYDWWQMQVDRRVDIKGKTVAEVFSGRKTFCMEDEDYDKEILCLIE